MAEYKSYNIRAHMTDLQLDGVTFLEVLQVFLEFLHHLHLLSVHALRPSCLGVKCVLLSLTLAHHFLWGCEGRERNKAQCCHRFRGISAFQAPPALGVLPLHTITGKTRVADELLL